MAEKLLTRTVRKFGWRRELPDHRDLIYAAPVSATKKLLTKIDLRSKCPPVYDQGQIGSCTGNAIAGAVQFDRMKAGEKPSFNPSRLFIYWNERFVEHTSQFDAGAQIRDGIKSVAKLGVCREATWPYSDIGPANENDPFPPNAPAGKKPSAAAFTEALKYTAISYHKVLQNLHQMKSCLSQGFPFVIGFTVYESFMTAQVAKTGMVPLPSPSEAIVGGHAVLVVGYDDANQRMIVRNSWGPSWGDKGYFYMPYAYVLDASLSSDFWTIRSIAN